MFLEIFYKKVAIFAHVTINPHLGVRYMVLDHLISIAVEILFLKTFNKAAISAQVTTPVTSVWVYLIRDLVKGYCDQVW